ncbi:DUF4232 domain-containing protein [Streptomyces shenzhenensis]|uniref:DUF4232 domain-containing protein n=1 Tax=Streptomyces shenzhenensis TaxID=943815 RepID=A0A3M0I077_9ACTN|nr:DUF4232 domain-containing protein [Streptomyces shenzhenensis]RMB79459.1 hypothetical protein CTZ28_45490 [Streptomyces shenzhenensis]
MRATPLPPLMAVAAALLLTACGSQVPGRSSDESGPTTCDVTPPPKSTATATGGGHGAETDGVRITDVRGPAGDCAVFQVTNPHDKPFRYTVTFRFRPGNGAMPVNAARVLASVAPKATVTGMVDMPAQPRGTAAQPRGTVDGTQVEVVKVRSVPTEEAPAPGGPCPSSGVRVYTDEGDAAMGLRVVSLHLENCGTDTYHIEGYPRLSVLDDAHRKVEGLRILHDGSSVAGSTGADGPPRPLVLKPGERAHTGLVWRNTVLSGTPVNAPYVRVWAKPGAAPVMVTPELDLGTTGKLAVGPWKRTERQ